MNLIHSFTDKKVNGLHLASMKGEIDTVVFLIEEIEMDPTVKNEFGLNCFLSACYGGGVVRYVTHRIFLYCIFFGKISTTKNTTPLSRWSVRSNYL